MPSRLNDSVKPSGVSAGLSDAQTLPQDLPQSSYLQNVRHQLLRLRSNESAHIIILYVLMLGGGLWHILNVLQTTMRLLSTPMIIAVSLWSLWWIHRYHFMYKHKLTDKDADKDSDKTPATTTYRQSYQTHQKHWYAWCIMVFVLGVVVELVGEKTGVIFGEYSYKTAPAPILMPIAIGAAWLGMMLASTAVITSLFRVPPSHNKLSIVQQVAFAVCIAVCMALFDGFMEPAAVALGYWVWAAPYSDSAWLIAPAQNYVAWFCLSFVFAFVGLRTSAMATALPMPRFVRHTFIAQLLYFIMTNIAQ